ncbi:MAG: hypothetical protein GXP37_09525 [Chloroflexi bacterium]|nr:hypothetical protein [Chloroflexota bacterium]
MPAPEALLLDEYYHIFNRGIGGGTIFKNKWDYRHFLRLYAVHIVPVAETYAYTLMPTHFHLLIRTFAPHEQVLRDTSQTIPREPSQHFANLFNAYAKYFNNRYQRTGPLFSRPFGRKEIQSAPTLSTLLIYIHQNVQHHGIVKAFQDWPYSSYHAFLSPKPSRIRRDKALSWFPSLDSFVEQHQQTVNPCHIAPLLPAHFE